MQNVAIVDSIRTPIGKRGGALRQWRADDLAAFAAKALFHRMGRTPAVDEVYAGCVMQVGEQSLNIARRAALMAGLPVHIPASTVDFQCGSGLQAVITGARQIAAGGAASILVLGTETMTRVPLGSSKEHYGEPYGDRFLAGHEMIHNGISAERIAKLYSMSRDDLDEFSFRSHAKAAAATANGTMSAELAPVPITENGELLRHDEGIRVDTSTEALSKLKPAFAPDGKVTAGSSSQISDGAAALLLMDAEHAARDGYDVRAKISGIFSVGSDPTLALTGPIDATKGLLAKSAIALREIDAFEVNEAFAPVVIAWQKEFSVESDRVNIHGGAIAIGHPLGCTGVRMLTTLMNVLDQRDGKFGLATICCNGGLGLAVLIERVRGRPD
jgi:acetyl-CoA acyltransferase